MHLRAAIVSALVAFPVFAQTTTTFQDVTGGYSGTRDARITCCDTATVNEGAAVSYALIPDSSTATLIRFAIFQSEGGPVPDGATINSASLALFQFFGPAAVFKVNRVLRSWNESAVNWNTTDGATAWQTIGAFGSADISPTADAQATSIDASANCGTPQPACWVTFNVTAAVTDMSSGGPKNGWKLAYVSDADGTQTNSHMPKELYSREATKDPTLRPTLTVTWTAGPPPPPTGSNTNTLQDVTGGYSGTRDARITCCDTATVNEGAAVSYALIPDSSTATLIRFAIFQSEGGPVPDGATINSASLALFQFFGPAAVFKVNRVLRSWNESAMNWNTTDGATAWQTIGAFGAADISPTADAQATSIDASANCGTPQPACWVTFSVTAAVNDMSKGGPRNGWKLAYVSDPDGTQTNSHTPKELYSREATKDTTLRPTLTVTWTAGPPPPTASLNAVPTFHSMGLYYNPPAGTPTGETVFLRYRKSSDTVWKHGHPLWNDGGSPWSARGSAVQLDAGAPYVFQFGVGANYDTATWLDTVTQSTWSETFPPGRAGPGWSGENTVLVPSQYIGRLAPNTRRSVLYIGPDQSGTVGAYTTYDFGNAATAHVLPPNDANTFGVVISANYVVLKNLKVIGGASGVYIDPGVHDVIIDGLDISGFGVDSRVALTGNGQSGNRGVDEDAGIKFPDDTNGKTSRVVIQNCSIHNPAFGASSWDAGHPAGPTAIMMYPTGGQIVVRYNAVWSTTLAGDADLDHFFEDGLVQGGDNAVGLGPDIDIYKNRVQHYFDDGLETDGQGINNRVWDNYFDYGGASAVSTTGVLVGPTYVFRNVYNRQRMFLGLNPPPPPPQKNPMSWGPTATNNERSYMLKSGGNGGNGGRRYLYHNTSLQAPASSMGTTGAPLGAGFGVGGTGRDPNTGALNGLENTKSRNNVFEMFISDGHGVFDLTDATPNDCGAAPDNCLDFDLTNGAMSETHGVPLTAPTYQAGNGWSAESSGRYRLQPGTPGYDQGEVIWGFNDNFIGANPDMGAQEDGTPDMQFGPGATGN